ncbi:MAG TPA: queuosine precursor transporter [Microthrixaceae bacterium]|nr:queuosine precursor transporter [Microthrixaceae bacterium]HPB44424.1 queuosine precursor transporter [Microthrixaceae bacterium]
MDQRVVWLIVLVSVYAAASLIANVMSIRAVSIFGWAVDAGTLTYPLTFTIRDLIHKVGGKRAATTAIYTTVALNVAMVAAFWVAAALPPDMAVGSQEAFGEVLNSAWRIVVASLVAQLVAELADTEIYQRYTDRFGQRAQIGRVLTSNAVSVPLDSVIFATIAFAGTFPAAVIVEIVAANIVIKVASSFVTAPLIYAVPGPRPSTGSGSPTGEV